MTLGAFECYFQVEILIDLHARVGSAILDVGDLVENPRRADREVGSFLFPSTDRSKRPAWKVYHLETEGASPGRQKICFAEVLPERDLANQSGNHKKTRGEYMQTPSFIDEVFKRQATISNQAELVSQLLQEEQVLRELEKFYATSTLSIRDKVSGEDSFFIDIKRRIENVSSKVDKLLPYWNESRILSQLIAHYQIEDEVQNNPERLTLLRRRQRYQLSGIIESLKRAEDAKKNTAKTNIAADYAERFAKIERSQQLTQGMSALRTPLSGKTQQLTQVESRQLSNDEMRSSTDKRNVASAAVALSVDYLTKNQFFNMPFMELYRAIRPALVSLYDAPNEKARIENFRYHIKKADADLGLKYKKGQVYVVSDKQTKSL